MKVVNWLSESCSRTKERIAACVSAIKIRRIRLPTTEIEEIGMSLIDLEPVEAGVAACLSFTGYADIPVAVWPGHALTLSRNQMSQSALSRS